MSGVSGLFTREFYRRVRDHLEPGGLLVQWFQLYEIDASLVASRDGARWARASRTTRCSPPSDHDLLIVASRCADPAAAAGERCSSIPASPRSCATVHVLTAGDLDARYLGGRATLEPLFASYGMPANSDYAPVLDLNAARHRFTEKSAVDVVGLLNVGVPVLELLEPGAQPPPGQSAVPGRLRLRARREHAPRLVRARLPRRRRAAGARRRSRRRCRRTSSW